MKVSKNNNKVRGNNPWVLIWFKPRETLNNLLGVSNKADKIFINYCFGIVIALFYISTTDIGLYGSFISIIFTCFILGAIFAVLWYYAFSFYCKWLGELFGGKGSYNDVRIALTYSCIPSVVYLVLWIISILLFGHLKLSSLIMPHFYKALLGPEHFLSLLPPISSNIEIIYFIIAIITFIIFLWNIIILVKCMGEAHQFSSLKAIIVLLPPSLLVILYVLYLNLSWTRIS